MPLLTDQSRNKSASEGEKESEREPDQGTASEHAVRRITYIDVALVNISLEGLICA